MATEDEDKNATPETEGQEAAAAPTNGASEPAVDAPPPKKEEKKGGRMSAAKAFYRAMYAGEDAAPEDFGIDMGRPAGQGQSSAADQQRIRDLEQHVSELETKNAETETHMKRLAADFENYRRRTEKEREEFSANGALRAIEAILPALDDLDRAQQTLNVNMESKAILEAFKLCANSFTRCLEQVGAKPLTVIGEPFDPRLHEPVQEIKTNEYPDSTVIHELRRGFMFKERVLRPALVNVTAALSEEEAAEQEAAKAQAAAAAPAAPAPAPVAEPEAEPAPPPPAPAAESEAEATSPAPDWVQDVAAAEGVAAAPAEEASAEKPAAEAQSTGKALKNLVKKDESKRSGTETVDINIPPAEELPAVELTAPEADATSEEPGQVYEISEEDAKEPAEDVAEAQPAKVSDD
ncbi:MAG: nucleotide exchange factor GrpE [Cyanobacteria bacterium PR.3.49]|nr:nucleotide exchange factor GrpE [Cyanobacteria bacterium PR.3.49]